jgi:hypothetical protein
LRKELEARLLQRAAGVVSQVFFIGQLLKPSMV